MFGGAYNKANKLIKAHPYAVGASAALAVTVGLGLGGLVWKYTLSSRLRDLKARRAFRTSGMVEDGMLKEAIGEFPLPCNMV